MMYYTVAVNLLKDIALKVDEKDSIKKFTYCGDNSVISEDAFSASVFSRCRFHSPIGENAVIIQVRNVLAAYISQNMAAVIIMVLKENQPTVHSAAQMVHFYFYAPFPIKKSRQQIILRRNQRISAPRCKFDTIGT